MEQRFCAHCGAQLRPDVRVCTACGRPVNHVERPASAVARTTAVPIQSRTQAPSDPITRELHASLITSDGVEFDLVRRETYLGRGESNDIRLDHPGISYRHARILRDDGQVMLEDLNSTNGTFLNGRRVTVSEPLKDGDTVTVGGLQLRVAIRNGRSALHETGSDLGRTQVLKVPAPSATAVTLYMRQGPGAPRQLPLSWDQPAPFTIGRADESTLLVVDGAISRHHAEIHLSDGHATVVDLGSANGTLVNGARVLREQELAPGDVIVAGPLELVYDPATSAPGTAVLAPIDGGSTGPELPLDRPISTVGSGPTCDIVLRDPAIAEKHARIQHFFADFWLFPLDPANPLLVNHRPVQEPVLLRSGDLLQFGPRVLVFRQQEAVAEQAPRALARAVTLREIAPFTELDEETFAALTRAGSEVVYAPQAEIVEPSKGKNSAQNALVVILEGEARVHAAVGDDEATTTVLATLAPGDFIGERALAYKQPYPYRVEAVDTVRAFRLGRKEFEQLTSSAGALGGFFKDRVARQGLVKYLRQIPLMARVPEATLGALATKVKLMSFPAGDVLARKGEVCRSLYVIASGSARVESVEQGTLSTLTSLTEGKYFGEEVAGAEEVYPHSVIAGTSLEAYSVSRDDYLALVKEAPAALDFGAAGVPASVILQRTPPFNTMAPEIVAEAARELRAKSFRAGETIIYQDDTAGSAFYIIASGEVDVLFRARDGAERSLAKLKAGQSFGEGALLTDTPRNATVKAITDCHLLTLYRREFDAIIAKAPRKFGPFLGHTFNARFRPKRIDNVETFEQVTDAGVSYILKNRDQNTYVSLSEEGYFIWDLLDGEHTLNDIAAAYYQRYKSLAMGKMFGTVMSLQQLGFLDVKMEELMRKFMPNFRPSPLQKALFIVASVFKAKWEFKRAHEIFEFMYRTFGRIFFAKPVLLLLILLNIVGVAGFVYILVSGAPLDDASFGAAGVISLLLIQALIPITHEIGHGITMVHIRRRVLGAGVGINLGMVMAFVNTTDAWMATKGQRIAVSLGGIFVTTTEAAIAVVLILTVDNDLVKTVAATAAFFAYFGLLVNIAPVLPSDGYNILMDAMAIPDLRPRSMRYALTGQLFRDLVRRQMTREQKTLAVFAFIVGAFLLAFGFQVSLTVTRFLTDPLQSILPGPAAIAVQILVIGLSMSIFVLAILKDAGFTERKTA